MEKDFLTTAEVGERLGVQAAHVTRLVKRGLIPHVRNGRRITIPRAAWEAYVAQKAVDAMNSIREGALHV